MLSQPKSNKLSLYLTDIILIAFILIGIFLPCIVSWWYSGRIPGDTFLKLLPGLLITCYTCLPLALWALLSLRRLLKNIIKGEIFVQNNIRQLNFLFICCLAVSLITALSGILFYPPFLIIGVAAGFFALILRVIKNVFRAAIEIKSENELTI